MGLCVVMRLLDASTELMNVARSANPQPERWEWKCLSACLIIHVTSWSFTLSLAAFERGRFITLTNSSLSTQRMIAENQSRKDLELTPVRLPRQSHFSLWSLSTTLLARVIQASPDNDTTSWSLSSSEFLSPGFFPVGKITKISFFPPSHSLH